MEKRFLTRESLKSIVKINLEQQGINCKCFDDNIIVSDELKATEYNLYYLINSLHHIYKINISTKKVLELKYVGELVDYFFTLIMDNNCSNVKL